MQDLCYTSDPNVQKRTVERYFAEDAGFDHPLCSVRPGRGSREGIYGVCRSPANGCAAGAAGRPSFLTSADMRFADLRLVQDAESAKSTTGREQCRWVINEHAADPGSVSISDAVPCNSIRRGDGTLVCGPCPIFHNLALPVADYKDAVGLPMREGVLARLLIATRPSSPQPHRGPDLGERR